MSFDISKVQKSLRDEGVDEEMWAKQLLTMSDGKSCQERMYAHRMIGELFMSSKLNQQKKENGILDEFGVSSLNLTVQERRRLGSPIEEIEVLGENSD
jgi:hypothetical protein